MEFEKKDWDKFSYKKEDSRIGLIGELTIKENKRIIDNITFKNNAEFKRMISIMKKYGFEFTGKEDLNKEVEEERKNLEVIRNKQKGFLEKDWEW